MCALEKKISYRHKPHFCIFCKVEYARIHEHFLRKHADEDKVREVQATEDKKERFWKWKLLTQQGDNYYNSKSEDKLGKGRIVKVPLKESKKKKYFDCEYCLGRLRTSSKFHHMKVCQAYLLPKQVEQVKKIPKDIYDGLPEELIIELKKSSYLNIFFKQMLELKEDKKIVRFYATNTIKLQEEIQKITSQKKPFSTFFKACHVDDMIEAIKNLSEETKKEGEKVIKYPFRAQSLCRLVDNLSKFLIIYFNKRCLNKDVLDVTKFQSIFQAESQILIRKPVYKYIKKRRLTNPKQLPKTSDIQTLVERLKKETSNLMNNLLKKKNPQAWRSLAENMLCRLTIFNRRRGGAVEKMTVKDYINTDIKSKVATEEALYNLNEEDKEFLNNVRIVEIIHKCDNIVHIFINKEHQDVLDLLLKFRNYANINKDNPYFFAAGKNSLDRMKGGKVMTKYRQIFPDEIRQLFTATNLRKHGATTAQVLELSAQDREEWATHLGHSVTVHDKYYRKSEQVNGILKTGRILKALDEGTLKYYKGKKIEDIPFKTTKGIVRDEDVYVEKSIDDSQSTFASGSIRSQLSFPSTSFNRNNEDSSLSAIRYKSTPKSQRKENKNTGGNFCSPENSRQNKSRLLEDHIDISRLSSIKKPKARKVNYSDSEDNFPHSKNLEPVKRNLSMNCSEEKGGESDTSGEWFAPGRFLKSTPKKGTKRPQDFPKTNRVFKRIRRRPEASRAYTSESD